MMEDKDKAYLDALDKGIRNTRASLAVFAVPLFLIMAQLRTVLALEGWFLSSITTVALIALSFGVVMNFMLLALFQSFEVKETLTVAGLGDGRGATYRRYFDALPLDLSEAGLIKFANRIAGPSTYCMVVGYVCLAALLLTVVWSSPPK